MERKLTALVTGATAGIGLATAQELARKGVSVLGVGRDASKCENAKQLILASCPGASVEYLLCDLSSQTQVRKLAEDVKARLSELDILVHVAGTVSSYFMASEDGIELQFAVGHLAPFLLTRVLLPLMKTAPEAKVVIVSSGSHYHTKLDFTDLQLRRRYGCLRQYKRVKLCNVLFAAELNRRLAGSCVRAFAADPGLVRTEIGLKGTAGIERFVWRQRMKSGVNPSIPGEAIAWLATAREPAASDAVYWYNKKPKQPNPYALRVEPAKLLWEASERYCGISNEQHV